MEIAAKPSNEASRLEKLLAFDVLDTDADTSLRIYCDKTMMESALKNLPSNAIKFSERNSTITLEAKRVANGIRFSVIDTGKGMSAEQASTLFSSTGFVSSRGTLPRESQRRWTQPQFSVKKPRQNTLARYYHVLSLHDVIPAEE